MSASCAPGRAESYRGERLDAEASRDGDERALLRLGQKLAAAGYRFVTVTPETHRRVSARRQRARPHSLRDIFGWSRTFREDELAPEILGPLEEADALERLQDGSLRSRVRFSSYKDLLFVHSAYPTTAADSVFFGPDTYRFLAFIERALGETLQARARIIDIGAGSGAGGLVAARTLNPALAVLSDVNERALRFAGINAALNGVSSVEIRASDVLEQIGGLFDLIVANPPYLVDPGGRLYRDGGGALGHDLSLRILAEGVERLAPGGQLLLYTGSAIVEGEDLFHAAARAVLRRDRGLFASYVELDPDVFGEELDHDPYRSADRIAAVGLTVNRKSDFRGVS